MEEIVRGRSDRIVKKNLADTELREIVLFGLGAYNILCTGLVSLYGNAPFFSIDSAPFLHVTNIKILRVSLSTAEHGII